MNLDIDIKNLLYRSISKFIPTYDIDVQTSNLRHRSCPNFRYRSCIRYRRFQIPISKLDFDIKGLNFDIRVARMQTDARASPLSVRHGAPLGPAQRGSRARSARPTRTPRGADPAAAAPWPARGASPRSVTTAAAAHHRSEMSGHHSAAHGPRTRLIPRPSGARVENGPTGFLPDLITARLGESMRVADGAVDWLGRCPWMPGLPAARRIAPCV